MNTIVQKFLFPAAMFLALCADSSAQEAPPSPAKPLAPVAAPAPVAVPAVIPQPLRRRTAFGGNQIGQPEPTNLLAENYRVTLTISGIAPEKEECSILTSSKQITLTNSIPLPGETGLLQRMEFSGYLGDPVEGRLELSYSINMNFPAPESVKAIQKGVTTNGVHYLDERATGTLRVAPGKSYEVLKSGIRIYTLKIEVESDSK
ncbi:MAG: hypothetical protein ACAI34_19585 [Verrucomicrobium sp.]|nr:hypothetical protein [Verrucomicrobium sp.]